MSNGRWNYSNLVLIMLVSVMGVGTLSGCARLRTLTKETAVPQAAVKTSKNKSVNIRVALAKKARRVNVTSYGEVKVYDMRTRKVMGKKHLAADTQIFLRDGRIMFDGQSLYTPKIRLVPKQGEYVAVNKKRYRGQIEIDIDPESGSLLVINYIPLEDYLCGVVPNEVLSNWPEQALQAQAVAARTFALYKMSGRRQDAYDLDATVNSQVYGGLDSEKNSTTEAVRKTTGQALYADGSLVAAFYHSNCGGHTANVKDVWGSRMRYLSGTACGFCDSGPHHSWAYRMTKADLEKRLRQKGLKIGQVQRLELDGRDSSGRIQFVEIMHSRGSEKVKAAAFRMMVGPDKIRSTKFYVQDQGGSLQFKGKGWGHGVGLCQEGAYGMAESGYNYRDILMHYYPGARLKQVDFSK